jgi:hypothetical protein
MSLAFLCNGHPVKYVNVDYRKRIGESKFHPVKDAAKYASTVLRIIMYFRPLRVFFPLSLIVIFVAMLSTAYHSLHKHHLALEDTEVILAVTALMVLVIGLLADLIVAQRRDIGEAVIADHSTDESIRSAGRESAHPGPQSPEPDGEEREALPADDFSSPAGARPGRPPAPVEAGVFP